MNASSFIKFCLTGRSGLGHLRRVANIASRLRELSPHLAIHLVVNAPIAGLSRDEVANFDCICLADRKAMAATLAGLPAGPVVVDTAVVPLLGAIPDPLCLVLRETLAARLPAFRLDLGRKWDATILPAPAGHWDLDPSVIGTHRVAHVGWIYRQCADHADPVLPVAGTNVRLLVATGGGGTQETAAALRAQIDPILLALRRRLGSVTILQVVAPRLHVDGFLANADSRIDVGAHLNEAFAEADAAISTVGYNSVLELAQIDTPALLVPCERSLDDQYGRAALWGPRLGHAHRIGDPETSAEWLAQLLGRRHRRNPYPLGENGAEAAARIILSLSEVSNSDAEWGYSKPINRNTRRPDLHTAELSAELFRQGVLTPPCRLDRSALLMTRVPGVTLRQRLAELASDDAGQPSMAAIAREIGDALGPVVRLHRASAAGLDLALAQPLKKVWSRLDAAATTQVDVDDDFMAKATALAHKFEARLEADMPPRQFSAGLVHGDLHAGQFVFDEGGNAWLLDLDDVAIGPPELDIANIAAHAVTSLDIFYGQVELGFIYLTSHLAAHYERAGGDALDPDVIRVFGASCLLRRAMKLRGDRRSRPDPASILIAVAALLESDSQPSHTGLPRASLDAPVQFAS